MTPDLATYYVVKYIKMYPLTCEFQLFGETMSGDAIYVEERSGNVRIDVHGCTES